MLKTEERQQPKDREVNNMDARTYMKNRLKKVKTF